MLICRDHDCRAAFEAEGTREAIEELRCEDCGVGLHATAWAAAEHADESASPIDVRRAA